MCFDNRRRYFETSSATRPNGGDALADKGIGGETEAEQDGIVASIPAFNDSTNFMLSAKLH